MCDRKRRVWGSGVTSVAPSLTLAQVAWKAAESLTTAIFASTGEEERWAVFFFHIGTGLTLSKLALAVPNFFFPMNALQAAECQ